MLKLTWFTVAMGLAGPVCSVDENDDVVFMRLHRNERRVFPWDPGYNPNANNPYLSTPVAIEKAHNAHQWIPDFSDQAWDPMEQWWGMLKHDNEQRNARIARKREYEGGHSPGGSHENRGLDAFHDEWYRQLKFYGRDIASYYEKSAKVNSQTLTEDGRLGWTNAETSRQQYLECYTPDRVTGGEWTPTKCCPSYPLHGWCATKDKKGKMMNQTRCNGGNPLCWGHDFTLMRCCPDEGRSKVLPLVGVAQSSALDGGDAYKYTVDNDPETSWQGTNHSNEWLVYSFGGLPVEVTRVDIMNQGPGSSFLNAARAWRLQIPNCTGYAGPAINGTLWQPSSGSWTKGISYECFESNNWESSRCTNQVKVPAPSSHVRVTLETSWCHSKNISDTVRSNVVVSEIEMYGVVDTRGLIAARNEEGITNNMSWSEQAQIVRDSNVFAHVLLGDGIQTNFVNHAPGEQVTLQHSLINHAPGEQVGNDDGSDGPSVDTSGAMWGYLNNTGAIVPEVFDASSYECVQGKDGPICHFANNTLINEDQKYWQSTYGHTKDQWIVYDFGRPIGIRGVKLKSSNEIDMAFARSPERVRLDRPHPTHCGLWQQVYFWQCQKFEAANNNYTCTALFEHQLASRYVRMFFKDVWGANHRVDLEASPRYMQMTYVEFLLEEPDLSESNMTDTLNAKWKKSHGDLEYNPYEPWMTHRDISGDVFSNWRMEDAKKEREQNQLGRPPLLFGSYKRDIYTTDMVAAAGLDSQKYR
eukprot:gnl/TRDRNA2_/TRDRNA2_184968_c0_seq1.p1 gnl/TRDRNA2_/TRDRNA2_184968_c0~~gnl/TRDRNA2_/TRDRNA2_184968_c0_seq1.p1  ORF type:complete len:753 (+),score=57.03 gnl/TRDRNA2_/TRDRNA2_184968_c0_seq1:128-2386(+)